MDSLIVDIFSGIVMLVIGYIVWINKRSTTKQKDTQDAINTTVNKMYTESKVSNANFKNFQNSCAATSAGLAGRVNNHGTQIDKLNITQREQDTRLNEHDRRFDTIEQKI